MQASKGKGGRRADDEAAQCVTGLRQCRHCCTLAAEPSFCCVGPDFISAPPKFDIVFVYTETFFLLTTPPSTPFYIVSISFLTAAKPRLTRSKQCPACIFRANFSSFDQKPNLTTGAVETRRSILIPSGVLAVHSLWTSLPLHPLTITIC